MVLDEVKELRIIKHPGITDKDKWEKFVSNHPEGNYFQSPAAYDFFSAVKGFTPYVFLLYEGDDITGVLLAVIIRGKGPKGFFSRRCLIWGGPIVLNNDLKTTSLLVRRLNKAVSPQSIFTEFRNLYNVDDISSSIIKQGFYYDDEVNFLVKISAGEDPMQNLNESKRRQIKKSFKNGARIIEAENINQVRDYYNILSKLYKEKIKKPLPDIQFFEHFFACKDSGRIFLVMYDDKVVGGIICPFYKDTIYEWYICGMDKEYKNIYPSVLATWAAIEYAWKTGLSFFNFMGAGKPDEYYGVRHFKSQFGGQYVSFGRYRRINQKFMYKIGEFGLALNQFLT